MTYCQRRASRSRIRRRIAIINHTKDAVAFLKSLTGEVMSTIAIAFAMFIVAPVIVIIFASIMK